MKISSKKSHFTTMRAKQKRYLNFGAKIQTFEKPKKKFFLVGKFKWNIFSDFQTLWLCWATAKVRTKLHFFWLFLVWPSKKKNVLQIFATIVCKNANPICVASCPFFSKKNLSKNTWQSFAQKSPENRVSQSIFGYCFLEKSK